MFKIEECFNTFCCALRYEKVLSNIVFLSTFSLFKRPSVRVEAAKPKLKYNCFLDEGWQARITPLISVLITIYLFHNLLLSSIESTLLLLLNKNQMLQIVFWPNSVVVRCYLIICTQNSVLSEFNFFGLISVH